MRCLSVSNGLKHPCRMPKQNKKGKQQQDKSASARTDDLDDMLADFRAQDLAASAHSNANTATETSASSSSSSSSSSQTATSSVDPRTTQRSVEVPD